jgi:hypothetical protein
VDAQALYANIFSKTVCMASFPAKGIRNGGRKKV